MNNALLSIITITKDDPAGFYVTLQSLIENQGEVEFEWIIVDGSTQEMAAPLKREIDAVGGKVIRRAARGISDALNFGFSEASGDWVLFLNAGDTLVAAVLKDIYPILSASDPNTVLYGDAWVAYPRGDVLQECSHERADQIGGICHQSVFISRKLHQRYLYDERLRIGMDFDLWFRLRRDVNVSFRHLNIAVSRYAVGGVSSNVANMERNLALHFLVRALNREPSDWLKEFGRTWLKLLWARFRVKITKIFGEVAYEKIKAVIRFSYFRSEDPGKTYKSRAI